MTLTRWPPPVATLKQSNMRANEPRDTGDWPIAFDSPSIPMLNGRVGKGWKFAELLGISCVKPRNTKLRDW